MRNDPKWLLLAHLQESAAHCAEGKSERFTILLVRVLRAHDGAPAEHHLVLGESARLVGEDVLDLAQILGDVQRFALDAGVRILVVQVGVVGDEEDLTDLHQFDGQVERDGDHDLTGEDRKCEGSAEGGHACRKRQAI